MPSLGRRSFLRLAGLSVLGAAVPGACDEGGGPWETGELEDPTIVDRFDRPDGPLGTAGSGQPWEPEVGIWRVDAGRARASAQFDSQVCVAVLDTGSADGAIAVDVALSSTVLRANVGVAFRSLGARTNLFVKLERSVLNPEGLLALGRQEDGAITYLARRTTDIGFDNGDTVRVLVEFVGPDVRVRVSTGEEIEHRLGAGDVARFGASTRHGLRVNVAPDDDDGRSTFDDFEFSPRGAAGRR